MASQDKGAGESNFVTPFLIRDADSPAPPRTSTPGLPQPLANSQAPSTQTAIVNNDAGPSSAAISASSSAVVLPNSTSHPVELAIQMHSSGVAAHSATQLVNMTTGSAIDVPRVQERLHAMEHSVLKMIKMHHKDHQGSHRKCCRHCYVSWTGVGGDLILQDKRAPWRKTLGAFLEQTWFHGVMLSLLLLDLLLVFTELVIKEDTEDDQHKWIKDMEHGFHIASLTILGMFFVEVMLLLLAFGVRFFQHAGYILDLIVVPVSFVLELTIADEAGLLVLLRCWRIVRVVHSVYEALEQTHERHERVVAAKIGTEIQELRGLLQLPKSAELAALIAECQEHDLEADQELLH